MKLHEGSLNGFWVTEWTRPYRKIYYSQFQRAITPKISNPELRFLCSARRLMLLYICVKFHENILNGFWVTERTRFCDRQTDGRIDDQGKNNMSPNPTGGDITKRRFTVVVFFWMKTSLPSDPRALFSWHWMHIIHIHHSMISESWNADKHTINYKLI